MHGTCAVCGTVQAVKDLGDGAVIRAHDIDGKACAGEFSAPRHGLAVVGEVQWSPLGSAAHVGAQRSI